MKMQVIFRDNNKETYDQLVNLALLGQNGTDEHGTYSVAYDAVRAAKHYINSEFVWDSEDEELYNSSPNTVGAKLLRIHCNNIEDGNTSLRTGYVVLTANISKGLDPSYNGEVEVLEKDDNNVVYRSLYLFQKQNDSKNYNYYFIKSLD